ncbi:MAG: Zn-dependent protease with chaperone function [Halieaceae bacterium]|jgi:Zn-dependent protease with chaperone function
MDSRQAALGFQAKYYDGRSSAPIDVDVAVDRHGRLSTTPATLEPLPFSDIIVKPRIGNSARYLSMPDGSSLETRANNTIDQLASLWSSKKSGSAHLLESNLKVLLAALIILLLGGYIFVLKGVPALSFQMTQWIPTSVDQQLTGEVLSQLDESVFSPSKIPAARQSELRESFEALLAKNAGHHKEFTFTLLFRAAGPLGANAFALPGGTIIVTDELVLLADDQQGLTGILLHEIGHVINRHSVQSLVQQAGVSALVLMISGDVTTASSLVLLLPTLLLKNQYSQDFETESDSYALQRMIALDLNPTAYADILEEMSRRKNVKKTDENEVGLLDYFSSHPPTRERIERFRNWQAER